MNWVTPMILGNLFFPPCLHHTRVLLSDFIWGNWRLGMLSFVCFLVTVLKFLMLEFWSLLLCHFTRVQTVTSPPLEAPELSGPFQAALWAVTTRWTHAPSPTMGSGLSLLPLSHHCFPLVPPDAPICPHTAVSQRLAWLSQQEPPGHCLWESWGTRTWGPCLGHVGHGGRQVGAGERCFSFWDGRSHTSVWVKDRRDKTATPESWETGCWVILNNPFDVSVPASTSNGSLCSRGLGRRVGGVPQLQEYEQLQNCFVMNKNRKIMFWIIIMV